MRSVSANFASEVYLGNQYILKNENFYMSKDSSKERILEAATALGPKASNTQITKYARFASRKAVAYHFGSKINLFKQIGIDIKSPKERLIEAIKNLPYYASSREITKKAGYKSHKIINCYFDSLTELKKASNKYVCNKEKINYKGVEFSLQDESIGVNIPEKIDELVAEESGLHAGDGCLYSQRGKPQYIYSIGGDPIEEKEFYFNHIKKLLKKVYNLELKPKLRCGGNLIGFCFSSKAIYTFKSRVLNFPKGNKTKIVEIPKQIREGKNEIKAAFVRGVV
ncbi:MAG: hypothetical protein ABIA76_00260 [Candidatus Diapherotrites archaeon]